MVIRGFYAADGNAADTGANGGDVWRVRFAPPTSGEWRYDAVLRTGPDIALSDNPQAGQDVLLAPSSGVFEVTPNQRVETDWHTAGPMRIHDGYAMRGAERSIWIKAGSNSPENFLAYSEFDGTRVRPSARRDGEASARPQLRDFAAHRGDWRAGDTTWGDGRGKGIVGAVNYLADRGMNSIYFLTMNIGGDGNDVWPYAHPDDPTRFDCSKLDQWDRLFTHMQRRGVALHMVLQETENERWLDDGDTGRLRQLYFHELIARFAHHPGLIWNLGEENGPADFSPNGQTDPQRRAMLDFFAQHDPYGRPVVLHTHATGHGQDDILTPLLGHTALTGISLQVDDPTRVNHDVARWRERSIKAGQPWWISMDEVGPWHTGATPDALDPQHDLLRRHALWGALLAGAGGVEWYFGARQPANDLSADNWRDYDQLWRQTDIARRFVQAYALPRFAPCNARSGPDTYCFGDLDNALIIYRYGQAAINLDLTDAVGRYGLRWFDPVRGGQMQRGSVAVIEGGARRDTGRPPVKAARDWVLVVHKLPRT